MNDVMMKLGRVPSEPDKRSVFLDRFVDERFLDFPDHCYWHINLPNLQQFGNDRYGNCVIATAANMCETFAFKASGKQFGLSNERVIELSRTMGALNGYSILERNKWWRKKAMWNNYSWAYARVNPQRRDFMKATIFALGAADIGVNMPRGWMNQEIWGTGSGAAWRPNSWGPHSICLVGYDAEFYYALTWGRVQMIRHAAIDEYCDEAYAVVNPLWFSQMGLTPSGIDFAHLHEYLLALTGRGAPFGV